MRCYLIRDDFQTLSAKVFRGYIFMTLMIDTYHDKDINR